MVKENRNVNQAQGLEDLSFSATRKAAVKENHGTGREPFVGNYAEVFPPVFEPHVGLPKGVFGSHSWDTGPAA